VLRHQRTRVLFPASFFSLAALPGGGSPKGRRDPASSAAKGTVTQPRPRGPLRTPPTPGHGVRWLCPGPHLSAGEQQEGMLPAPCRGPSVLEGREIPGSVGTPFWLVVPCGCNAESRARRAGQELLQQRSSTEHKKSPEEQSSDELLPAPAAEPAARGCCRLQSWIRTTQICAAPTRPSRPLLPVPLGPSPTPPGSAQYFSLALPAATLATIQAGEHVPGCDK